ncbi:MAG: hypothetical protein PHS30_00555 [Bacteroidales bacterium]|nr:hypothetical protein [Bacteroidales bacterium]
MKLLVVTTLAEYDHKVSDMLTQVGINVFSKTETTGYKETPQTNLLDNWYGADNVDYNSTFFFSFTEQDKAESMLKAITECNNEKRVHFPIRGFIIPVESSTYQNEEV